MQNFIKADEFSKPITATRIKESILMTIPTAIYAVIYLVWFNYIETRKVIHFTEMHTRLDDMIPFMEVFVIPYILWFFFIAFCTAYPLLKYEKEDYWRFMIFLGTGMTLFLIISTIFPTIQYLRPAQFERNNIFTALVSVFYKYDTPTNVFPSMHVYNAIGSYNYGATYRLVYGTLMYKSGTNLVLKTKVDTALGQIEKTEIADFSGYNVLCIDEHTEKIYVPKEDELLAEQGAGDAASKIILHTEGGKQRQLIVIKRAE